MAGSIGSSIFVGTNGTSFGFRGVVVAVAVSLPTLACSSAVLSTAGEISRGAAATSEGSIFRFRDPVRNSNSLDFSSMTSGKGMVTLRRPGTAAVAAASEERKELRAQLAALHSSQQTLIDTVRALTIRMDRH